LQIRSNEVSDKERLVLLEDHTILDDLLLVQVVPGSVGALLAVSAIFQDPVAVFILDGRLHLRDQLIINPDIAVRGPANDQLLLLVLTYDNVRILKIVWREDLELKLERNAVSWRILVVGRIVSVRNEVRDDIGLTDIDQKAVSNHN